MIKTHEMAYELFEEMAANAYQWPTEISKPKKAMGVHKVDTFSALSAQVATLSNQNGSLTSNAINTPPGVCELYSGPHPSTQRDAENLFPS